MADGSGCEMLSDAVWAAWEPLIEEVRPRGKTLPKELRRTISAIFWRHQNGAKWRSIPAELGPWWLAAQLSIRWAKQGVWEPRDSGSKYPAGLVDIAEARHYNVNAYQGVAAASDCYLSICHPT